MKAVKKMLVSMELHLDASIDMMMAMMIYTWMAIMIMIGMTGIVIIPMVWMTQWVNLTRSGKYGRQIVKKRSRNDIILDGIRKQDTENII